MSNPLKIELAAMRFPACFTAFDLLYYEDHSVTDLPLTERKALLQKAVIEESARFAVSRVVENNGVAFFQLAKTENLEGIVAKRKDSRYYFDKRTKDWIKCKNLKDTDYVVCGYLPKENGRISLVLGQYAGGTLTYKGHVTLGVCGGSFRRIRELPRLDTSTSARYGWHRCFAAQSNIWRRPNPAIFVSRFSRDCGRISCRRNVSSMKAALQKSAEGKELPSALFRSYR